MELVEMDLDQMDLLDPMEQVASLGVLPVDLMMMKTLLILVITMM